MWRCESHVKTDKLCTFLGTHDRIYFRYIWLQKSSGGGIMIKGYFVSEGYMGYVDGEYQLFADERDYVEYIED